MSKNSRNYLTALYGFDAAVRRVAPETWDNPSPCPEWTAADIVGHNIGMCDMVAGFASGTGAAGPAEHRPDDPAAAWARSFAAFLDALDTRGALQTVTATPWGEMPVDAFLGFAWVDPLIHTWDLAKATAQEPMLDTAQVERGLAQLVRAGDALVGPRRFGAPVAADASLPTLDRLIATSGRNPHWS